MEVSRVWSFVSTCLAKVPLSSASSSGCAKSAISSASSAASPASAASPDASLPARKVNTLLSATRRRNTSTDRSSTISIAFAFLDDRGMLRRRLRAERSSSSVLALSSLTSSGRSLWNTDASASGV